MSYKHGVYGETQASSYKSEDSIGTLPVYIGTLPIHRINAIGEAEFDYTAYIDKPMLISSYKDISELGLYSDDLKTYTLCEALRAHFMNGEEIMAPIVLINVLNPTSHIGQTTTSKTINVNKEGNSYTGYIEDPLCVLDDLTITADGVEFAEGDVSYAYDGDNVKIMISKSDFTASSVTVTYKSIDFSVDKITSEEFGKAVNAVDDVEPVTGLIPTILVAPAFSEIPANHDLMIQKAIEKAGHKWNLICVSDIPATAEVNTIALAKGWKTENQYNSKYDKVCWPLVASGDYVFHLSTITAFQMQLTDFNNGDTPHVSPSNKVIGASRVVLADGKILYIKEYEANELNEVGITTVNLIKQQLRLWGSHMANYSHANATSINPEDKFDAQVRMMGYLLNYLQYNYLDEIDQSFTRKDVDSILNSIQTWLDSLVNDGKLLYASISFDDAVNDATALENGDITFDLEVTYAISVKSITFKLQYTRAGLTALIEGGEE